MTKQKSRSCSKSADRESKLSDNKQLIFPDHVAVHVVVIVKGLTIFFDIV